MTQNHKELLLSNHREDQAFEYFRTPHLTDSYRSCRIATVRMIAVPVAYRPQGVTHVPSQGSYRCQDNHVEVSYFSSNHVVQRFKT